MTADGNQNIDALTEAVFGGPEGSDPTPLHQLMRLRALARDEDSVTISMELTDLFRGPFGEGSIHGGMLATFADVASAVALTYDRESEISVTTDLHVRYYRQPRSGPLTAEATVVHRGRRLLGTECVVTDAEQRCWLERRRPTCSFPSDSSAPSPSGRTSTHPSRSLP